MHEQLGVRVLGGRSWAREGKEDSGLEASGEESENVGFKKLVLG